MSVPALLSERPRTAIFWGIFFLAVSFAAYTGHVWEDFYITFRASKHLATGEGLVFTPGERLHTFTSPLGVLVPALLSFLTGNDADWLALWLFRLVGAAGLGLTGVLLYRVGQRLQLAWLPLLLLLGLFGVDGKIVDYSINGMETPFLMLFLALTLDVLTDRREGMWWRLGLAWAGLMWSRPDCFIYIGALGVGALWFFQPGGVTGSRRELMGQYLRAGLVTTAVYLPWLLWAKWYYGSPVPHTVVAKGLTTPPIQWFEFGQHLVAFPLRSLMAQNSTSAVFQPALAGYGGWHYSVAVFGRYVGFLAAFYWLVPGGRPLGRAASLACFAGNVYLSEFAPYVAAWYLQVPTLLGIVAVAECFQQALAFLARLAGVVEAARLAVWQRIVRGAGLTVLAGQAAIFLCMAWQMRVQQDLIEEGNRVEIALFLREHAAAPNETVFLEPLGYIGFFSQLKMYDYPGLSSLEVVQARRELGTDDWHRLIRHLQPHWLVLRPSELALLAAQDRALVEKEYKVVKTYDATAKVNAIRFLPGRGYVLFDARFAVLRKADRPMAVPPGEGAVAPGVPSPATR